MQTEPNAGKRRKTREGLRQRHTRSCSRRGRCDCPWQAYVFDSRAGRQIFKLCGSLSEAKLWRSDAMSALARGTMARPGPMTLHEAAENLIAGLGDGSVLDRTGKPYKPSAVRSYTQALRGYVIPALGTLKLSAIRRQDVQRFVEQLHGDGLAPSTIHNKLDPLRVIFRRALRDDLVAIDPTDGLELPSVRGRRDRIVPADEARALLDALPKPERALWTCAVFAGLRRGELRGLRWEDVDFEASLIRVERGWDDREDEIDAKSQAGRRAVPMAREVRQAFVDHKLATGRDGIELVFGRTARAPFVASTVRARALKAWGWERDERTRCWTAGADALEPLTLHEARHCAISYWIAAGMDWKKISTWAGHGDVRQTWNRYGHLVPGGEAEDAAQLDAYLDRTMPPTMPRPPEPTENARIVGLDEYRYGDSNPGRQAARRTKTA